MRAVVCRDPRDYVVEQGDDLRAETDPVAEVSDGENTELLARSARFGAG